MATPAKVIDLALALPRDQRAELASTLLRSLEEAAEDAPDEVATAWAAEIERRIALRDAGGVCAAPFDAAIALIRAQLVADDPDAE